MVEIDETASNILEKLSTILEKPYRALGLGAARVPASASLSFGVLGGGYFGPFFTFLHVVSGITWIGLLYYFNLVQIPIVPNIPAELKPAIGKYIAPEALFWFRWSALATVVTGLIVFSTSSAVHNLPLLPGPSLASSWPSTSGTLFGRTRKKCSASFPPTTTKRQRPRASPC